MTASENTLREQIAIIISPNYDYQDQVPLDIDDIMQAFTAAVERVIGPDFPLIPSGITNQPSDAVIAVNYEKSELRKRLAEIVGKGKDGSDE